FIKMERQEIHQQYKVDISQYWNPQKEQYAPVDTTGLFFYENNLDLLYDYYGPKGLWLVNRSYVDSRFNVDQIAKSIDHSFLNRVRLRFGLSSPEHAYDFYMNQMRTANKSVSYVLSESLPAGYVDVYGLRNEVVLHNGPTERLMRAVSSYQDEIEQFELVRQLVLAGISSEIEARTRRSKPYERLYQMQNLFNRHFFNRENKSTTHLVTLHALHDNDTNEYLEPVINTDYMAYSFPNSENTHVKYHRFQARSSNIVGNVLTQPRKKRDEVALIKAVDKSRRNNGIVDISKHVQDPLGILFVALDDVENGNNSSRDALYEQITNLVSSDVGTELEDDNKINTNRSSSQSIPWKRVNVKHSKYEDPVELIFFSAADYINYHFNVGDGSTVAHSLYEVDRSQRVFTEYFPQQIYNGDSFRGIDLQGAMRLKRKEREQMLRQMQLSQMNDL
ncbi:MAG TPA: hypothetical protein PLS49_01960, partial [Candidatus Woesebacteria bacterium]|nr:hypothetical protein [Candidatus Woesebacteria bacterium]